MSNAAANQEQEQLRYPIGKFQFREATLSLDTPAFIASLEALPAELRKIVEDLNETQLDTPYRPEGWTVRQLVHHVADSHMHSYLRFRWALTEENPTIKTYEEKAWALLPDAHTAPPEVSLRLLGALHARWVLMLNALSAEEWKRTFQHPQLGPVSLEKALALYAWHGKHHLAHIAGLRQRMGW